MTAPTGTEPPAGNAPAATMRERMLNGELYRAADPELQALCLRAQRLLRRYNAIDPADADGRGTLLAELFGSVGAGCEVRTSFYCDYGAQITVGDRFFANFDCVILDCAPVTIGDGVLFGPGVQIYAATHPLDPAVRRDGWESAAPVTIGDDVWVGGGAIVLPGVTIGAGAVIGAGSVVTRDVPPRTVAAGNPCRPLRTLPENV